MESTNKRTLTGRVTTAKPVTIPHKDFRIAYMEHLMASKELTKVKPPSRVNWWEVINRLLYPIGFILLALEIFL